MDAGKRKALVTWINALKFGSTITCLEQLSDGRILYKLDSAIKQIDTCADLANAEDIFGKLKEHLRDVYHLDIDNVVDTTLIVGRRDETEIAKVLLLLLCVPVVTQSVYAEEIYMPMFFCENSGIQEEIVAMVKFITEWRNPFHGFFAIFSEKLIAGPRTMVTAQTVVINSPQTNDEVFSNSPLQMGRHRISSLRDYMSPLLFGSKSTCNSPTPLNNLSITPYSFAKKLMAKEKNHLTKKAEVIARQRNQEIKDLRRQISSEIYRREELEHDLAEKTKAVEDRDHRIKELTLQIKANNKLRALNDGIKDEIKQKDRELARLNSNMMEHVRIKEQNGEYRLEIHSLNEDLQELYDQLEKSTAEVRVCQWTCARERDARVRELQIQLDYRDAEVVALAEARQLAEKEVVSALEFAKEQKESFEELLRRHDQAADMGPELSESLGFVTQRRIGELEEDLKLSKQDHDDLRTELAGFLHVIELHVWASRQTLCISKRHTKR